MSTLHLTLICLSYIRLKNHPDTLNHTTEKFTSVYAHSTRTSCHKFAQWQKFTITNKLKWLIGYLPHSTIATATATATATVTHWCGCLSQKWMNAGNKFDEKIRCINKIIVIFSGMVHQTMLFGRCTPWYTRDSLKCIDIVKVEKGITRFWWKDDDNLLTNLLNGAWRAAIQFG